MQKKRIIIVIILAIIATLAAVGVTIGACRAKKGGDVTITFNVNGGKEISAATVKKGEKYILPTAEKDGLVFAAWYYDDKFANVCPKEITAEKDEKLYARYYAVMTFDVNGGTDIAERKYYEGDTIGELPISYKSGFSFYGWFYDAEFGKKVDKNDLITRATTVYAKFAELADTIRKVAGVKGVSDVPEFEISTDDLVLHNENISDYISLVSANGEELSLICRPSGSGRYIAEPNKKLEEGMTYTAKALSSLVKFVTVDGNDTDVADEVTLTTYKEQKEIIEKKPTVHITSDNLARFEENVNVYMDKGLEKDVNRITLRTDKEIAAGTILTIGENVEEQDDDYICKVISVKKERMQYVVGQEILEDDFVVAEVVSPDVDDIYYDIDIYGERQAELEGVVSLSAETVAENVAKNDGVVMLKRAVRNAVAQSPTVTEYAKSLPTEAERTALMAAIGSFDFKYPTVRIDISGTVLSFEIALGGEIQIKNIKIAVSVTIKNRTQVDYRYTICKSKLVTLNPLLWFYTDVKVELSNDFSLSLAATVEFADSDDDIHGIIDITDEVEYIMDISKDGQNKFAEAISGSPLWDDESDLEYADIFSIPLGQIPLPVPVVSLMLEFNVVGSLGARAGLYVEFAHHYVETTTLANGSSPAGENGKPVMYKEFMFTRATTANEIDISITLKGQVGFRCGLEARLSLSVLKLNSVASVYVSFRFGPYIELSGLVSFKYSYDVITKESEKQLLGGMYLEVGLFVNAKLGAKFLVYDINTDIFDKKIALYGVGDRLIPLGFTEKSNSPENPYVIVSRYGGVRMNSVQMKYLDIVTGEEVVDNALRNRYGAQLWYEFEFVDVPDYQTKGYEDYVTLKDGGTTLISKNYPYKTLNFVVKAKLLQRHGVYASGIERIFYVEFRNPDGRDYATQYSEFINDYYVGGGSRHSEVLARLAFKEGEQVTPPDFTAETLPIRQGYYLDMNDLWEKYYPFLGNRVDDEFDGTFPVVTYENANMIFKGYMIVNTCYYRLKWKQRSYTAKFYYPEYSAADTVKENKLLKETQMIYVPSLSYFVLLTDKITAPEIYGKKYSAFVSSCGLRFVADYYLVSSDADAFKNFDIADGYYPVIHVNTESDLFLEDFEAILGGAEFVAKYDDQNVYTETYVLETGTVKRVKAEYKPFDYPNGSIRPIPPQEFAIGSEFTANGKTYIIKGYRDINPADENNCRYYTVDDMPDVTKNRIYYLLFDRKGYDELPVYYVNIVANGTSIGSYGVKSGEEVNLALLKINYSDERVISRLTGYAQSEISQTIDSYSVEWDETAIPTDGMPEHDIVVNLTAEYTFKELRAEFVLTDALQSFAGPVSTEVLEDGNIAHVEKGRTWVKDTTDESAFYPLPKLNDYFNSANRKYYSFYGWQDANGDEMPYGIRIAFVKNERYIPVFAEKTMPATLAFVSVGDYGYEYYYKIVEGDYFGKTLAKVIADEKIAAPDRGDVEGRYEYEFIGWGVNADEYVIGTEKESDGNVKTYVVFKAEFKQSNKRYVTVFDALGGKFANGAKTLEVDGRYGDKLDIVAEDYADEKGKFTFVCWTTVPYSLAHRADKDDLVAGMHETYYAYYSLEPATITLTFKGRVEGVTDGSGVVYFDGDKTKTELKVSDLYGRGYYLTANRFTVDSVSKTFVPDYLKWTADGEEQRSAFYNDGYMAYIPFDRDATVEIVFKAGTDRIVNIAFVSDGECYELDGTLIEGIICNGFMSGFRHVANYYEAYGSKMLAPNVDYYSENYYRFDRWESKPADGSVPVSVRAGEEIVFTDDIVFYGVYVHDTTEKVQLTFRADTYNSAAISGEDLAGLTIFADGSVEIIDYGTAGEKVTFDKTPSCKGMRFVGWTADGKEVITASELKETTYSTKIKYYAVYERAGDVFEVTLNAGDGKFTGGETEKTFNNIPFGRLADKLEKPLADATDLVFSHYEDEDGYPIVAIERNIKLYAKYAKPVSTFKDLQNINLAPEQNYVLTNDIIEGGAIFDYDNLADWTALGADAQSGFSGVFNGNGYKIRIAAKSGTKRNFGIFAKVSGTIYNLSLMGSFSISGSTDATTLGAFVGELTASGKIIDCHSMAEISVAVSPTDKLSVSGAIGTNNGLIDGLIASAGGQINIDGNNEFAVGVTVGTNNGRMKNVNQSGRSDFSAVSVSLVRSLNCYIGSFVGYNSGEIKNCFAERPVSILLSQGDNVYLKESVLLGGFVGKNDGTIENATTLCGNLEYSVNNITLFKEKGLYLSYIPYLETPRYIIYAVGSDSQGPTYTTKCVIYLDEDAEKKGSDEYEEYTLSEFTAAHPAEAKKIESLRKCIVFNGFVADNNGNIVNTTIIGNLGIGNIEELVSACGFDQIKWSYITLLHEKIYD